MVIFNTEYFLYNNLKIYLLQILQKRHYVLTTRHYVLKKEFIFFKNIIKLIEEVTLYNKQTYNLF